MAKRMRPFSVPVEMLRCSRSRKRPPAASSSEAALPRLVRPIAGGHQLSPEGGLEVSVTADPAWTVVLERSVNLDSWEVLKVFGSGEILTLTIPSSHALPSQFFRARTP